jgi:hypothetical protein
VTEDKPTDCDDNVDDEAAPDESAPDESTDEAAERKFVEDTLVRGEAAEADEEGDLPREATHEIVEQREGELPKLKRRRFKAF